MQQRSLRVPVLSGRLTTEAVDRTVAGRRDDPARRTRGNAGGWPALHCCGERILDRLLSSIDVTEDPNEHGHGTAVLLPEYTLDLRGGERRPFLRVRPRLAAGEPRSGGWWRE